MFSPSPLSPPPLPSHSHSPPPHKRAQHSKSRLLRWWLRRCSRVNRKVVLRIRRFDRDWAIGRRMEVGVSRGVKIGIGVRLSLLDVGLVGLSKCVFVAFMPLLPNY